MPKFPRIIFPLIVLQVLLLCISACAQPPATQPGDIVWLAAGTKDKPSGVNVPLTPSLRQAIADALTPAPLPVVVIPNVQPPAPPVVALPALTRKVADATKPIRGDGINWTNKPAADVVIRDTHVEGWSQNIVAQAIHSLTLDNVRSVRAWRDELPKKPDGTGGPDMYSGQALYVADVPVVRITNYFARDNGYQLGRPWGERSPYHHTAYLNFGTGDVTIDNAILDGASMAGLQPRISGKLIANNCVILACGIALENVMGRVELHHCTIYDGRQFTTDGGKTWTGGLAARIYWPVLLDDVWIVGAPNQAASPKPGTPAYPQGAIVAGGDWEGWSTHPLWKRPPPGEPLLTCKDVVIVGWPTDDKQRLVIGAGAAGITFKNGGPVACDYKPVLDDVEAGKITIPDGVQRIRDGVRGGVK